MGYYLGGFDVIVGVDKNPQPKYPFIFIQTDVLDLPVSFLQEFDAVHASPPCQLYSDLYSLTTHEPEDLIPPTRDLLLASGLPFIIENVERSPLFEPVTLCGTQFDLGCDEGVLRRHRLFESNHELKPPNNGECYCREAPVIGVYGHSGGTNRTGRGRKSSVSKARQVMGTPWLGIREMAQAIPPAYTEYLAQFIL